MIFYIGAQPRCIHSITGEGHVVACYIKTTQGGPVVEKGLRNDIIVPVTSPKVERQGIGHIYLIRVMHFGSVVGIAVNFNIVAKDVGARQRSKQFSYLVIAHRS